MSTLQAQLPALLVVVPLLAAPLCVTGPQSRHSRGALAIGGERGKLRAIALALAVGGGGRLPRSPTCSEGWAAPWGIEYRIDALNALVVVIVAGASTVSLAHARLSVAREVRRGRIGLFYTAWLLCLTGMLGIAITGDVFNVFVFLEIASLSTYVLVALGPGPCAHCSPRSGTSILGSIGATFFLVGIGLLYMMTGTLNMADLSVEESATWTHTRTVAAGVVFVVLGIGLKAADLSRCTRGCRRPMRKRRRARRRSSPEPRPRSPSTCWCDSCSTSSASTSRSSGSASGCSSIPLAIAGVLVGSAIAVFQGSVKRLLAWSSIAQLGYMVLGLGLGTAGGVAASLVHLFNHAVMKVALFLAIANLVYRVGLRRARERRRARAAHAVDDGRLPGGRDEPGRGAAHRGVRVEVVPAARRAGGRDVADRGRHPGVVAPRRGLHVAGGERRVLHRGPPRQRAGARPRGALDDGRAGGRARRRQHLVRSGHVVQRGVRGDGGRGVVRGRRRDVVASGACVDAWSARVPDMGPYDASARGDAWLLADGDCAR